MEFEVRERGDSLPVFSSLRNARSTLTLPGEALESAEVTP